MAFISGNRVLTESEMEHNAIEVWSYFKVWDWTLNAVAGMLGNMQAESTINPGRWEKGVEYGGGYGLVQWTPYTNYSNWAGAGWQNNGTKQCERIIYEWEDNYAQWGVTSAYPITFKQFSASTETPEYLASAFLYNYERPRYPGATEAYRQAWARKWYNYLGGVTPTPVLSKGMPVWMMCRPNIKRRKRY